MAQPVANNGAWDASAGTFPADADAIGDYYTVSVAGTVDGEVFDVNDFLVAETATPSTTVFAGNWSKIDLSTDPGLLKSTTLEAQEAVESIVDQLSPGDVVQWDGTEFQPVQMFYRFYIWAEENGGIAAGQNGEYSFGNGATGNNIGLPVQTDCELVGMVLNAETFGTSATVRMRINGVNDAAYEIVCTARDNIIEFGTPRAMTAGDRISFATIAVTGTWQDVRVGAVFRAPVDLV